MTKEFLVVFETGPTNFGAFAPDIPGCVATGTTIEQTRERYLEAVTAHLEWMAEDHDSMPEPRTTEFIPEPEEAADFCPWTVEFLAIPMPAVIQLTRTAA